MKTMERQQDTANKEAYKEHLSKEIAKHTGANIHDSRNDSHQEMRTERVDNAVHFDISHDDDVDVTMTASTGVQAEAQTDSTGVEAKAQTTSSGYHQRLEWMNLEEHKQPKLKWKIKEIKLLKTGLKK